MTALAAPFVAPRAQALWRRAGMRAGLAAGAALGGPIRAHGLVMDPMMSALVRVARRMQPGFEGVDAMRAAYADAVAATGLWPAPGVRVRSADAGGRPARLYQPRGTPRGTLVYFHGGGFIMGSPATHDGVCRRIAARAGVRVLSASYRLAPEHPFPAAHEDAAAVLRWARDALPGPLLLGGDSAGANLAASAAAGAGGSVAALVLVYPVVDMVRAPGRYPSLDQFGSGFLLTTEALEQCRAMLLPGRDDHAGADPRLSPIRADLRAMPPAIVAVAGFDPLADQGRAYAAALIRAGGKAKLIEEPSLVHGFADFAGVVPAARRAVDRLAAAVAARVAPSYMSGGALAEGE